MARALRYAGDGWTIKPESQERERSLLNIDAQTIKDAIASTQPFPAGTASS